MRQNRWRVPLYAGKAFHRVMILHLPLPFYFTSKSIAINSDVSVFEAWFDKAEKKTGETVIPNDMTDRTGRICPTDILM